MNGHISGTLRGRTASTCNSITVIATVLLLVCGVFLPYSRVIAVQPSNGLVAYYPFDGNANDASGNENHGTVVNAILTADRFGSPNSAYEFNGTSSRIVVPDNDSIDLIGDFSIGAWIKPRTLIGLNDIVTKHVAGPNFDGSWAFKIESERPTFAATPYFDPQVSAGQSVLTGIWQHVLFTYRRSNGEWRYYINGQQTAFGIRTYFIQNTTIPLLIGCEGHQGHSPPYYWFFDGVIDDIHIYNRVLSAEEVATLATMLPVITMQPQSRTVLAGQSTTFTVQATGNPAPTYQWRRFGIDIPGATGPTLTLNNVRVADAGNYSVVVRNSAGVTISASAKLGVLSFLSGFTVSFTTYPPLGAIPAGADSLVFITHGRTGIGADSWSGPDGQLVWMNAMKSSIQNKVPGNWAVVTYEWEVESRTDPRTVLGNATKVGSFVGNELAYLSASRPNGRWAHIHFIAHSAGSALIEQASRLVENQNGLTEIHSTFLDPFTGVQDGGREEYGVGSDWSDNYFSYSPDTWDGALGRTFGPMLKSHDVEVTWLDPDKALFPQYCASPSSTPATLTPCSYLANSTHGWPIKFYQRTIDLAPAQLPAEYGGYGFRRSKEGGGWANRSSYPAGNPTEVHVLGAQSGIPAAPRPVSTDLDIDFANTPNAIGLTGQVQFTGGGCSLTTSSAAPSPPAGEIAGPGQAAAVPPPPIGNPAWISILPNVTSSVNFVTFNAEFTGAAGSMGLLTVYWNDEEIGQIDERNISPGVHSYTFEIANAFLDRSNTLGFRLDQFSPVTSGISVTNVKTGFAGLPTPPRLKIERVSGIATPVLTMTGTQNFTYLVETSPDLVNWEPMAAVTLDTGVNAALTDPAATGLQLRFYRAVSP